MDSKRLLLLAFGELISILLLIAIIGITQMQHVINNADEITTTRAKKIELAIYLNDVAVQRMIIMHSLFTTDDPFDRDDQIMSFRYAPLQFIKNKTTSLGRGAGTEAMAFRT